MVESSLNKMTRFLCNITIIIRLLSLLLPEVNSKDMEECADSLILWYTGH